jgi:hypothetical protein
MTRMSLRILRVRVTLDQNFTVERWHHHCCTARYPRLYPDSVVLRYTYQRAQDGGDASYPSKEEVKVTISQPEPGTAEEDAVRALLASPAEHHRMHYAQPAADCHWCSVCHAPLASATTMQSQTQIHCEEGDAGPWEGARWAAR